MEVYIVEDEGSSTADMWREYLESFSKEEAELGASLWEKIKEMFKEHPEESFQEIVETSIYPGLEEALDKKTVDYIKALLTDYCMDWLDNHEEEEIGEEQETDKTIRAFYAEDMLRIFYYLTKIICQQKTTINNLWFGFKHLEKENKLNEDSNKG